MSDRLGMRHLTSMSSTPGPMHSRIAGAASFLPAVGLLRTLRQTRERQIISGEQMAGVSSSLVARRRLHLDQTGAYR